ncbi:2Fe-2S iron-sulfur cluster-binding protein [Bdellovibrio svalbardensis]|uniref:(2Fe-2S)-binding protein n=1 Tax=Bdellovibrio svalbardensis TaxID=2972972 RepID=A0ABT6DDV8_9BACT|nr:2Fe-2S iron-sulfur cluster-binding protein [Bdellovibrio svalbardensis]MDG0815007.1 (2Fe-2S)-binding protein [Bdellovibrio svalbardensis]
MKPKSGKSITFLPDDKIVLVSHQDETVLNVAIRAGLPIDHTCGGFGTCGTCVVFVRAGLENLPPRNEIEAEMAQDRGFLKEERLCCQIPPVDGLVLERP